MGGGEAAPGLAGHACLTLSLAGGGCPACSENSLQAEQHLVCAGIVSAARGEDITSAAFQLSESWGVSRDDQTMEG